MTFLEIQLGRLAQKKGRDPAVKRFGETMKEDHTALQKQWSDMASRNGMKFKPGMGPNHRAKLEAMEKVSDRAFDRAYMTLMIQNHHGYVNYWRTEGLTSDSPTMRQIVNRGLPTLEKEKEMAKRIGNRVGVDAKAALAGPRISAQR
jgi:putative membrane protein